jgi:hypothetical protein
VRAEEASPKTTRPKAESRRPLTPPPRLLKDKTFDAFPDRIDLRDWFYQPRLSALPDQIVNCDLVPGILDQGREGACTGFALAAVINFLLRQRNLERRASPRMLYEMARRYDEWPGETYEGSSARGAMKGWVAHGVCPEIDEGSPKENLWPKTLKGFSNLTPQRAAKALEIPGGAYYRVKHREVRDMHAALNEVGILYVTLMVHDGWAHPGYLEAPAGVPQTKELHYAHSGNTVRRELPIIRRRGRSESGHAVAIVGYTRDGFIVQNSWGREWGANGFALLPYEDYLLHATDVWVAQLGVPVSMNLWTDEEGADQTSGLFRAARTIPLSEIRPYVIDIGNEGKLSDSGEYWTTESDLARLFTETIPEQTSKWSKARIVLYLHGGLNDEAAAARRIVAFRDVFLANQIYPLHVMWETGAMETLKGIVQSLIQGTEERAAGIADWMRNLRDGLLEARDRTFELTVAAPGSALWRKMKENARDASRRADKQGGMQLAMQHAQDALDALTAQERKRWELHVVGHSAGSIFAAHAIPLIAKLGVSLKTFQLLAPAITTDLFRETVVEHVKKGECPHPTSYVLSDVGERDDDVGPYGKSLLYLVSNAFEQRRKTPLLGMERFVRGGFDDPTAEGDMVEFFGRRVDGLPSLIVAGEERGSSKNPDARSLSRSESHGGFDNDPATMNAVLWRILGEEPTRQFSERDLQFDSDPTIVSGSSRMVVVPNGQPARFGL